SRCPRVAVSGLGDRDAQVIDHPRFDPMACVYGFLPMSSQRWTSLGFQRAEARSVAKEYRACRIRGGDRGGRRMSEQRPLTVHIGHDELIIRRRYEVVSICNDILIALWFIAGSIMFFYSSLMVPGTWCFLLGS